jgi:hypothetical protein
MITLARLASTVAALALAVTPAQAAVHVFNTSLSGLNEVPAVISPGGGFALVTVDDAAFTMRVVASFSGLSGITTAAHIHCCAPIGSNAAVATTTPSFVGFPLGVTAGSMDQTYDMALASSYRAAFITGNGGTVPTAFNALLAGLQANRAYFNVHTTAFPGGEIRGQLTLVPEPSGWALMLSGFGALAGALRTRRRLRLA